MKEQILQQSYPSDNSSQFAMEFPLASATEQGLYFFLRVFFTLSPSHRHTQPGRQTILKNAVKQITAFTGKCVVSSPVSFTSLYLTLI